MKHNYKAQSYTIPTPKNKEKKSYNYILVYRKWEASPRYVNGMSFQYYDWITRTIGFENWDELIKWLNSSDYISFNGEKQVRINEDELIAIYDLTKAEKINVKLIIEEKIEIQEKKRINYEWKKN